MLHTPQYIHALVKHSSCLLVMSQSNTDGYSIVIEESLKFFYCQRLLTSCLQSGKWL